MASPIIPELLASAPHPDQAEALALYGQFVGSWDQDITWYERDGSSRRLRGEWHFGWILGGRAIGDVWMVPTRAELDAGATLVGYGLTVRVQHPGSDTWTINWHGVVSGIVMQLRGRREGSEIVQEGAEPDGHPARWIFSEITSESFHWRNEVSDDGGKTWWLKQSFAVRRRR